MSTAARDRGSDNKYIMDEEGVSTDLRNNLNQPDVSPQRLKRLESGMQTCRDRLDGFGQELKILCLEINIIAKFVQEQFGTELISRASQLRNHIHDFEEIEELSNILTADDRRLRRSTRQLPLRRITRLKERKKRINLKRSVVNDVPSPNTSDSEVVFDRYEDSQLSSFKRHDEEDEDKPVTGGNVSLLKPSLTTRNLLSNMKALSPIKKTEMSEEQESLIKRKRIRNRRKPKVDASNHGQSVNDGIGSADNERSIPPSRNIETQCEACGKILKGASSLRCHMNMHADVRPYPCLEPGCGKRFRVRNKLKEHALLHTGDKKEQCRFCGRLFYFRKDLARHERVHTGEKPYECTACGKNFNVKQHLTLHMRIHTGERPYQCPVCHKFFSQANSLRIHKKIHEKMGPAATDIPEPTEIQRFKKGNKSKAKTKTSVTQDAEVTEVYEVVKPGNFEQTVTVMLPAGTTLDTTGLVEIHELSSADLGNQETSDFALKHLNIIMRNDEDPQLSSSNVQYAWHIDS